jgi:transcriptional regulator GlxA family with amidase domain
MRVTRAAELLIATGLPLKEVSARVGMENAGVSGRAFRSFYEMTPRQFRRVRQGRFPFQPTVIAEIVNK